MMAAPCHGAHFDWALLDSDEFGGEAADNRSVGLFHDNVPEIALTLYDSQQRSVTASFTSNLNLVLFISLSPTFPAALVFSSG